MCQNSTKIQIALEIKMTALVTDRDILNYLHRGDVPDRVELTRTQVTAWIETVQGENARRQRFIDSNEGYDYGAALSEDREQHRRELEIDLEMTRQDLAKHEALLAKFQAVLDKLNVAAMKVAKSVVPCPTCETPDACKQHGCGLIDHPGNDIQFDLMGGE